MGPGQIVRTFRPRRMERWKWGIFVLSGSLAVLSASGYGAYRAWEAYVNHGPIPAITRSAPWFLLAGLAVLVWLGYAVHRWFNDQRTVRLHTGGFSLEGLRLRRFTWDQIDGIACAVAAPLQHGSSISNRHARYRVAIHLIKGRPIILSGSGDGKTGLQDLLELASCIKARLYPRLQPELERMFQAGLPLYFGPITIDRVQIHIRRILSLPGTRRIPWTQVGRITIQSGYFLVELSDHNHSRYRIPVANIPNLELLLQLIDQGVTF